MCMCNALDSPTKSQVPGDVLSTIYYYYYMPASRLKKKKSLKLGYSSCLSDPALRPRFEASVFCSS